ncbi:MAG: DNA-binding protein [Pseudanabaena sp.]|jgi:DNA-binding phage protein
MPTYKSYHSYLIESLKDPLEAAAYLDAVLEDGDFEHILLALKNVAEAQQDITNNSKNNKLNLDLNSQLFPNQQPSELMTIAKLLNQLGLKLSVTVQEKQPA